jgi:hypothetical protein
MATHHVTRRPLTPGELARPDPIGKGAQRAIQICANCAACVLERTGLPLYAVWPDSETRSVFCGVFSLWVDSTHACTQFKLRGCLNANPEKISNLDPENPRGGRYINAGPSAGRARTKAQGPYQRK